MMTRPLALDDIRDIVSVSETAIEPDGSAVVFTRRESRGSHTESSLWSVAEGGRPRRLTDGPADRAPRVCADGILFLRDVAGVPQLHLLPSHGEAIRLTDLALGAGPASPSPDGRRLAFTAPVDRAAADTHAPIVIDTLDIAEDGRGWVGQIRRHVFVLDLDSRRTRQVTDGDDDSGEPAWSPDGTRLAFTAGQAADADLTRERRAVVLDVRDPLVPPQIAGRATGLSGPLLWTPDGASLVAVGMPTPGVGNARLLRLRLDGGEDLDLTAGLDRNVMPGAAAYPGGRPALTADGRRVVFCARDRGWTHLLTVDLESHEVRRIVAEPHLVVSALSVASDTHRAAVVLTSPRSFAEVTIVDLDRAEHAVLTDLMGESLPEVELYRAEPRQFAISDGTVVHGWITAAPETDGAAPLLLDIHGGPHNAWAGVADDIHLYQQLLAARGWRVLTLNVRGSDGYGEQFLRAIDGEWGRGDLRDFLEPIDQLVAEGIAHPDRLAVTGYSYGGLSTCALTAHTRRFAAAVAGGLLCDFSSIAGNHLPEGSFATMTSHLTPLDVVSLVENSPIAHVDRVRTPTLVLHGENDQSCPVGQARQWFSALRSQGVPTRMVVYPGDTHLFIADGPVDHRIDYHARLVEWVEQHTRAAPRPAGASPAPRGAAYWRRRLRMLCDRYDVPGAQFGIVQLDEQGRIFERLTVAAGTTNVETGEPVVAETAFQIGSITKVWTTMLVMQLVDEGLVDLDAPVRRYLPEFAISCEPDPATTVRELLTHTSGIDGDVFTDTGSGQDCVRRYVEQLATVGRLHPAQNGFSYCNAAFVVAGRIVEVVRAMSWDEALRRYLIEPLGLAHTFTLAEDAPLHSTAVGHTDAGDGAAAVTRWSLAHAMGPAGLISASADDVLTFAATALREGESPAGNRVLSSESTRAMTGQQVDLRDVLVATQGWGLGWFLQEWSGQSVIGHDGGTIGQRAYLRLFPQSRYALVLLTNGGRPDGLYAELFADAAGAVDGSVPPALLRGEPSTTAPLAPGRWTNAGAEYRVGREGDQTVLTIVDRADVTRRGAPDDPVVAALHSSNIPGVYAYTLPGLAGWEQFRPVPGGIYAGYRFAREDAP